MHPSKTGELEGSNSQIEDVDFWGSKSHIKDWRSQVFHLIQRRLGISGIPTHIEDWGSHGPQLTDRRLEISGVPTHMENWRFAQRKMTIGETHT